jgi:chitinase
MKLLDPNSDVTSIQTFNALKKINPKLKTLVAIGGWNEGSARFSLVASDPQKRGVFAKSARDFVQKYGFDGLDVDWEYPG